LVSEGDDTRRLARLTAAQAGILLSVDEPQVDKAMDLLRRSYAQMEEYGTTVDQASIATELGRAAILVGQANEAEGWARRSLELLGEEPRLETAHSWMILAQAKAMLGESEEASRTARLSASMLDAMGASRQAAQIWKDLGDLMRQQGEHGEACVAYDRALESMGLSPTAKAPVAAKASPSFQLQELSSDRMPA
jgi:tetratricopeptide (TPR) repeat protein